MQPYPSEFKEAVLERVLSGEISMNAAAQTYKLAFATVRKWRDDVLAANMPASLTTQGNRMNRLILPKSVSYLKAHEAVVLKHVLGEVEFGKYCRKAGITTEQVNQWQQWFETHPEACNREELTELCVSLMAGIAIMYGGITKAAYLTSMKVAASELVSRVVEQ